MPKISAVMALYNTPLEYLKATIESLLSQTFSDFELIIIDDASTIEYEEFFAGYNDERIKYFKLERNSGPGHARNVGFRKAIGEYTAITDSDDIYMPERFKVQADFLDNHKNISLISGAFRFSNRKKVTSLALDDKDIKTLILFNSSLNNPAVMLRRQIFSDNNLFYPEDKSFAEDYELWINAMFRGIKMANSRECLMIYTRRPGQLSKAKRETQINILKKLYALMLKHIGVEASKEDLDLHYNIYAENFTQISSEKQILDWFDLIIEHGKNFFDEQTLLEKKSETLKKYKEAKNRLFKIKIGGYNICVNKKLKISVEERD